MIFNIKSASIVLVISVVMCLSLSVEGSHSLTDWGEKTDGLQLRARVPDSVGYGDTIVIELEVRSWPNELPDKGDFIDRRESAYARLVVLNVDGSLAKMLLSNRALFGYMQDSVLEPTNLSWSEWLETDSGWYMNNADSLANPQQLTTVAFDPWTYIGNSTGNSYPGPLTGERPRGPAYLFHLRAIEGGEYRGRITLVVPPEDCRRGWTGEVSTDEFDITIGQEEYEVEWVPLILPKVVYLHPERPVNIDSMVTDTVMLKHRKGFRMGYGYGKPGYGSRASTGVADATELAKPTHENLGRPTSEVNVRLWVMESSEGIGHRGKMFGWGVKTLYRDSITIRYIRPLSDGE